MPQVFVREQNVLIAAGILLTINLIPLVVNIPVFPQLLLSSCSCVYIGCQYSARVNKGTNGVEKAERPKQQETLTKADALKFPIMASVVLSSFYIVYKYISAKLVNVFITAQFCLLTIISTSNMILPYLPFKDADKIPFFKKKTPKWLKDALDIPDIEISKASLAANLICSLPVLLYFLTKHWLLNNMFGILFSIVAIRSMNLGSFQVGFILLWLLFFYDIFWVYGTDVMVTVAKNLDIPIKLLYPYLHQSGQIKNSMLGLGDIVIPGVFVSICLKFDVDRNILNKVKSTVFFRLPYFNICFLGYVLGIFETFAALVLMNHPQPALLFLVPMTTLLVLALSLYRKESSDLYHYETDQNKKTQQIQPNQQNPQQLSQSTPKIS